MMTVSKYSFHRELSRDELSTELDVHPKTIGRYDAEGAPHDRTAKGNRYSAPEYRAWMCGHGHSGRVGRPADYEADRLRRTAPVPAPGAWRVTPAYLLDPASPF